MPSDDTKTVTYGDLTVFPQSPSNKSDTADDGDSGRPFKPGQSEWAAQFDHFVYEYLKDYFEVSDDAIHDIEGHHDGNPAADPTTRILQELDYAGIDKLVKCPDRTVMLGFRCRPQNPNWTVDFSYCYDNGREDSVAEYDSHLTAFNEGGIYPDYYTFSVVNEDESGLDEFYLINMNAFLGAIDSGSLTHDGDEERDGGVWAYYYPVEDLREHGCIVYSDTVDSD